MEKVVSARKRDNKYLVKQYLYLLTFPNEMVYVGIAYDIADRWVSSGGAYKGQPVYDAICEFGWENVKKEVLLYIPSDENGTSQIRAKEQELIEHYGDRCYNQQGKQSFYTAIHDRRKIETLTYGGQTKTYREWGQEQGVTVSDATIRYRIKRGWSVEDALFTPPIDKYEGTVEERRAYFASFHEDNREKHATRA